MATRIATANGNFTTAGTWGVVDATALLDSQANNTVLTTAYVESQSFTPGAITIDGIAVKVATRASSPSGTISVRVAQGGATVAGTEVTIDVSDIESRNGEQGWYFFKFAAPVTLLAATLYTVSAKTSALSQVNLYRNATAGNWSRMLRTTTTGAPAAGDNLFVLGEYTAAATKTDRSVTMDSTAATDYGGGDTTVASFGIGKGGTLTWGTTAATNYQLRWSGIVEVWRGGVWTQGGVGTEIPRDSTALLQFDCAADGDFGFKGWGTVTMQGLSRTSGKNIVRAKLNTDEAAAQTVLGVDTDTGWKSGDSVALASTTRTNSEHEERVLNGDAGASSITVTVGLTNAHSGTSPTQAEVILLTRNVRVESVSATFMAYVYFGPAAVVDLDWVQIRYMGSTTSGKRGVECDISSGSLSMHYCCLRDFDRNGLYPGVVDFDNWTISDLTAYKVGFKSSGDATLRLVGVGGAAMTGAAAISVANVDIIGGDTSQGIGVLMGSLKPSLSNINVNSGGGSGLQFEGDCVNKVQTGTIATVNVHSLGLYGVRYSESGMTKISSLTCWRNNTAGLLVTDAALAFIETATIFGNTINIDTDTTTRAALKLRGATVAGDSTFSVARGLQIDTNALFEARLENCSFGVASGIFVAHTTADIDVGATTSTYRVIRLTLVDTVLGSATEIANKSSLACESFIRFQRADGTTNTHRIERPAFGTVSLDTTTVHAPSTWSEKMEPAHASTVFRLESGPRRKRVLSGATVDFSVWVRKSSLYTGSAPRLMLRANPALGIDADTVLDTFTAAADTWENLVGTSAAVTENGELEVYVDCTGTAGAVYVSGGDFTAT